MSEFLDIPTLIIIGVAILVLLRLRSVLGTRTGTERPPSSRISEQSQKNKEDDKVIVLHPANDEKNNELSKEQIAIKEKQAKEQADKELLEEIEQFANGDEVLASGLKEISAKDANFTPSSFIDGAKAAYEMIVTAFANGDTKTLKNLLDKEIYEDFLAVTKQREQAGYKVDFTFIGLPKVEFADAKLEDNTALITIRFFAEVVSATRDSEGNLIEGNADQVANIADIWTFARDVRSKDPNWKLVATDQLD